MCFIAKKVILMILFLLQILYLAGCAGKESKPIEISTKSNTGPQQIIIEKDSLTLVWAKPDTNYDLIDYYELFYRNDTLSEWIRIDKKIPAADTPKVTLSKNQFKTMSTSFYFAVRSANNSGTVSDFCKSSDGDWFILWDPK